MSLPLNIPIPPCPPHPAGNLALTSPSPSTILLSISIPPDNRLTTPVCEALLSALDAIEFQHKPSLLLLTSAIPKFFSNGLDLDHAVANQPRFWREALYPLFKRLLTYPIPTVSLVNGHAFAAGLMLALCTDYRLMCPSKGFLSLPEILFSATLKPQMVALFRAKLPNFPRTYRALALEARRIGAEEALDEGIIDGFGCSVEEAIKFANERNLGKLGRNGDGVWGLLKVEMYKDALDSLDERNFEREEARDRMWAEQEGDRQDMGVEEAGEKAKL